MQDAAGNIIENRFKQENGAVLIEIKLREVRQIFNSLDPAPFHEKDLDEAAEKYITDAVSEFELSRPIRIVVYLPSEAAASPEAMSIPDAVRNHYAYLALRAGHELHRKFGYGRRSLAIGLCFLFLCLTLRQIVAGTEQTIFTTIITEGLLISGWVAMWTPISIFLYEWWPIRQRQKRHEKISRMEIEIRHL